LEGLEHIDGSMVEMCGELGGLERSETLREIKGRT